MLGTRNHEVRSQETSQDQEAKDMLGSGAKRKAGLRSRDRTSIKAADIFVLACRQPDLEPFIMVSNSGNSLNQSNLLPRILTG